MFPDLKTKLIYLVILIVSLGWFVLAIYNLNGNLLEGQDPESVKITRFGLVAWVPLTYTLLWRYFKLRKLRKEAYKSSLSEGGVKDAQILRDLTEAEKNLLLQNFEISKDNNFYLDSRAPIFKIQGQAFVETLFEQDGKPHFALHIRNKTFVGEDLENFKEKLNQLNGKEINVEFSPRSQRVWRISNLEENKAKQEFINTTFIGRTREITKEEKKELDKIFRIERLTTYLSWLICFIVGFVIINQQIKAIFEKGINPTAIFSIVFIVALLTIIIVGNFLKSKYFFDRRSPVYRLQGKVSKINEGRGKGLSVENIKFSNTVDNHEVEKAFDALTNGDFVTVEYSPRTKHIWKMYKTEDTN